MASYGTSPQTITGKVRTRTPVEALSSRYAFLNLQNAEPNLGIPGPAGVKNEGLLDDGYRYFLLSNNNNSLSGWRVWSYDTPRIVTYSKQNSLAIGENANPINFNSVVYNNHPYGTNRYNSQSFADDSFNVFSLSGIYLFDATTIGDPASATAFVVSEDGKVGINVDEPNEAFTVLGNISARGNLTIVGNSTLGRDKTTTNTLRGNVRIGDSSETAIVFGVSNGSYDTNLYRTDINTLRTDGLFVGAALSGIGGLSAADVTLTNANVTTLPSVTASGDFLILNINGASRALRLWNY